MLVHHHLIVTAGITKPPTNEEAIEYWLEKLIFDIDMNVLYGPKAIYCEKEGNRGMTAFAIIDTSHICLHTWDEEYPAKLQLDVYSCAPFEVDTIVAALKNFNAVNIEYKFLDRTNGLFEIET